VINTLAIVDNPQVHDLVQINPDSVSDIAPSWVSSALDSCPWAVVRRVPSAPGAIAIGVRGNARNQRWGGFICRNSVSSIVRPMDLLAMPRSMLTPRTPAMKALQQVRENWQDFDLTWGPIGSVALELVSAEPITTDSSDLDIVINAPRRLSVEQARSLWYRIVDLDPRVDVRVETAECGFSLQEYACASAKPILLRYRDGVTLGDDPWSARSIFVRSAV
jgi:phosphoribosyl-dephospho-CoA transferase